MPAVATAHTDTINASLLHSLDQIADFHARRALQGMPLSNDLIRAVEHVSPDPVLAAYAAELGHREGQELRNA